MALAGLARRARALRRDRQGIAAMEFALAGPPFLLLIFVTMQLALQTFIQASLDYSVAVASRQVQLGTIGLASAGISSAICENLSGVGGDCGERLTVKATSGPSFTNQSAGTFNPAAFVLIEADYKMQFVVNWLATIVGQPETSLISVAAFRNEPFP